jgi:hypothetical protein
VEVVSKKSKYLTVRQDTMVLSVKSQCHGIPWAIGSDETEQTSAEIIRIMQNMIKLDLKAYFDMFPILHRQGV